MDDILVLLLTSIGGLIIAAICCGLFMFFAYPQYVLRLNFRILEWRAGMKIKYIGDEKGVFCYGEKNVWQPDKTSLIFIHGFSASKDQWIPCFKHLPSDLHMIALDLPGHGGSSIPDDDTPLTLEYVLGSLNKFFDLVGLQGKRVHLIGSSLGGAIVGVYSARHPEFVDKVSMVCPAMETPVNTVFSREIKEAVEKGPDSITHNTCVLLPDTVDGVKKMMDACCYNKQLFLTLREQIWKGLTHLRMSKNAYYLRLFRALASMESMDLLNRTAPDIKVPSQIIWGKNDEVVHCSGAEQLKSRLPDCRQMDIIENCGHCIELDRPGSLNKALITFHRNADRKEQ